MIYKQAFKSISVAKKTNKGPLDIFFLPLVIDLGYKLSFDDGDKAGKTTINHDTNTIIANLTDNTQLIFFNSPNSNIKFEPNKIYIYMDEDYSLIVQIPRFSSMYHKFTINFDKTDVDVNKFDQLISLITYRKDAKTDEKSMRSLQLDTDLSAFQNDDHELLQTVMHIINQALSTNDIGLIQFIIKKINSDYHTQYTNKEIMNILKADFKRRQMFQHQYMLVDVFEMAKQDETRQKEIQNELAKHKAAISQSQIESANKSTEKIEEKPKPKPIDPKDKFKALFYGDDEVESNQDDASSNDAKSNNISSKDTSLNDSKSNNSVQNNLNKEDNNKNVEEKNYNKNNFNQENNQHNDYQENNFSSDDFTQDDNNQNNDNENDYQKLFRQNNNEQNNNDLDNSEQKDSDLNNDKSESKENNNEVNKNKKEDDKDGGFDYSQFF